MSVATVESRAASVSVSVAILLVAFVVFKQAGEYQSLGPLDLETADRLALAFWIAAPLAGGLAARRFSNGKLVRGALTLGLVVGLIVALFALLGSGTGDYTCAINLAGIPGGYPLGGLAVGALAGLGMGIGFLVSGAAARRPVTAPPGVVLAGAATWATSAAAFELFYGAVRCLR